MVSLDIVWSKPVMIAIFVNPRFRTHVAIETLAVIFRSVEGGLGGPGNCFKTECGNQPEFLFSTPHIWN
ncbi:hypothetical protein ACFQL4_02330 [Halosimplex aquaticum]